MPVIETVLQENRVFPPSASMIAHATIPGKAAYDALVREANTDYEGFWARLAKANLDWRTMFSKVLDASNAPYFSWFGDGELNASYNSLDRHLACGHGDRIAIVFESDDGKTSHITYEELHSRVCRFANGLKTLGVGKGDRVVIYMPMSVEAVVAMQGCARIGAIHSVVFGGFSSRSLNERVRDVGAVALITANEQVRGGRALPLKAIADEALTLGGCESVRSVIVYRRTERRTDWNMKRDIWMDELVQDQAQTCEPEWVNAEHPLFILYTSGSTGKPKGVIHSTGGYLLWSVLTMKWSFDLKPEDIFWCTADIGWITGHTYICYGPLACGATQVIFEGIPVFPHAGRFWEMIQRHGVTIFYTAPTAIRSLIKASDIHPESHPRGFDLGSLRVIGTVGETIAPETWTWYHENVGGGRCPVIDTWWQTETGGHMIAPLPGATVLVPGSCTLPLPGIMAGVVDETGQDLPDGQGGLLVVKRPWPSMIRGVWGDAGRFKSGYYPEELGGHLYLAGDGAVRDKETGYFTIMGRIDDVLNVSGHRLGTMEIESVLESHPMVAEAAVVGRPDAVTGEAIVAFVVLKRQCLDVEKSERIATELRTWVAIEIGPIAKPKEIRFGDNLPKTRSGKVMRRLLRSLARGDAITQDVSTLEDPFILEQFRLSR